MSDFEEILNKIGLTKDAKSLNDINLVGKLALVEAIGMLVSSKSESTPLRDFALAGTILEMLPNDIPKDPVYAALAIKLYQDADSFGKHDNFKSAELAKKLAEYCERQCKYFKP